MYGKTIGVSALLLVALSACQPNGVQQPALPGDGTARCNIEDMQDWIGQDVGLFDPAPGIEARIIEPGDPVTRDYRPNRVTFEVDDTGRIVMATCG